MPRTKSSEDARGLKVVKVRLVKEEGLAMGKSVKSPDDAIAVMAEELADMDREMFCVLNLKTNGTVINMNVVSMGSLSATHASPREIFKSSILSNAASIVLLHNHPSGNPVPSADDYDLTKRLCESGKILGIPVLDHIVISGQGIMENYSMFSHDELGKSYSELLADGKIRKGGEAR